MKKILTILNIVYITSLITVIYQFYLIYIKINNESGDLGSEITILMIFLIVSTLAKSIDSRVEEIKSYISRTVSSAISKAGLKERVVYIGTSSSAKRIILQDARKASVVWNTNLAIRDAASQSTELVPIYESFFKSKNSQEWNDLVGLPDLFSERYKTLSIPSDSPNKLNLNILRHSAPIVNFIQLKVGSRNRTYFGWVGFNDQESDIFVTECTTLNALFRQHFRNMFSAYKWLDEKDEVVEVQDGKVLSAINRHTQLVDKVGTWLTIEWSISSGIISKASYGLIDISYNANKIVISPNIYDLSYSEKKNTKHIDAVKNYGSKLYFNFSYESENAEKIDGMCSYDFQRNGDDIVFYGHLHRYNDWTLNKITGLRISRREYNRYKKNPSSIAGHLARVPQDVD